MESNCVFSCIFSNIIYVFCLYFVHFGFHIVLSVDDVEQLVSFGLFTILWFLFTLLLFGSCARARFLFVAFFFQVSQWSFWGSKVVYYCLFRLHIGRKGGQGITLQISGGREKKSKKKHFINEVQCEWSSRVHSHTFDQTAVPHTDSGMTHSQQCSLYRHKSVSVGFASYRST